MDLFYNEQLLPLHRYDKYYSANTVNAYFMTKLFVNFNCLNDDKKVHLWWTMTWNTIESYVMIHQNKNKKNITLL